MPSKPAYDWSHQRARKELLADHPFCVHCHQREATIADHQPPLSMHDHEAGAGCCELVPSCYQCSQAQAGELGKHALLPGGKPPKADDEWVEPFEGIGIDDPCWQVPWLVDLIDEMPDTATWPRFMTVPHPRAVGSWGVEFETWTAARTGKPLRWWQRLVARRLLEYDDEGLPCWPEALMSVARQLGKSFLMRDLCMWRIDRDDLFGSDMTTITFSRNLTVMHEIQRPARRWAKTADGWHALESNGKECVERTVNGNRWVVRSSDSVYGFTGSFVVGDEVWDIQPRVVDEAIAPTLVEIPTGQLLLTSTAHRKATALYPGRRRTAIDDMHTAADELLIVEWSAHRDEPIGEVETWRKASPHWTPRRERVIRLRYESAMRGESADVTEPDPVHAFTTQWLNAWPVHRPRKIEPGEQLLDADDWVSALRMEQVEGAAVFAVEDNFGQGAAVAWCGRSAAGTMVLGGQLFERRSDAYDFVQSRIDDVLVLVAGASLSTDPDLRAMTTAVKLSGSTETRAGLSRLRDQLGRNVFHDGSPDLADQVLTTRVRLNATGLAFATMNRTDLLRCAVWALCTFEAEQAVTPGAF